MRPFGEAQSKMRVYAQSRQYHTIVESRVRQTLQSSIKLKRFIKLSSIKKKKKKSNLRVIMDGFPNSLLG